MSNHAMLGSNYPTVQHVRFGAVGTMQTTEVRNGERWLTTAKLLRTIKCYRMFPLRAHSVTLNK